MIVNKEENIYFKMKKPQHFVLRLCGLAKIGTTWRQIKSIVVSPRIELGSSV